jgi:hypothetical protein
MLILTIDDVISKLATYHTPKSKSNKDGESFGIKFWRVLIAYAFLTLIFSFAIVISLRFSGITAGPAIVLVAPIGTLTFLIIMRLLLNPTWDHPIVKLKPREKLEDVIKLFKERIFSIFFSYVCITWIVFILYLLVCIGSNIPFQESINYFFPSLPSLAPSTELFSDILTLFAAYVVSLFTLAFFAEIFLLRSLPIIQTPWDNKEG